MDKDRGGALRAVEFHILISLAAGERHGYGIIQDIQERGETAGLMSAPCTAGWRGWSNTD